MGKLGVPQSTELDPHITYLLLYPTRSSLPLHFLWCEIISVYVSAGTSVRHPLLFSFLISFSRLFI
jgi:hypothetical protein